jgi:hypothetical protein
MLLEMKFIICIKGERFMVQTLIEKYRIILGPAALLETFFSLLYHSCDVHGQLSDC